MASIFDRVKRLAGKLDRDKSRSGFQLFSKPRKIAPKVRRPQFVPGGFAGGKARVKARLEKPKSLNVFRQIASGKVKTGFKPLDFIPKVGSQAVTSTLDTLNRSADLGRQANIQAARNRTSGMGRLQSAFQPNVLKPTGFGIFQGVKSLGQLNPVRSFGLGALSAGITGIVGDKNVPLPTRLGEGFSEGTGLGPILSITNPLISKAVGKVGGGFLAKQIAQRGVAGAGNVAEDKLISVLEDDKESFNFKFSFIIGAALAGNTDLAKFLKKKLGTTKLDSIDPTPKKMNKVVKETRTFLRDRKGKFSKEGAKAEPELFDPVGGKPYDPEKFTLQAEPGSSKFETKPKAKSRLKGFLEEKGFNTDPQSGKIQLGPKPKQLEVKDQDVSLKASIADKSKLGLPETKTEARLRTETQAKLKSQASDLSPDRAVLSSDLSVPNKKYAFNINKPKLGLKGKDAAKLDTVVKRMRPVLEARKGAPLTNKEIIKGGRKAQVLDQVMGRDQAAEFSKQLQATRNAVKTSSQQPGVTPQYLAQLEILSSTASDAGRRLRAFNINAEDAGIKQNVLQDLQKIGIETQRLIDASKGVDWDNASQVTEFYRKFKPADFADKLTEYRYVNMLSSPNTHIINFFTNFLQTGIVAPIEKTLTGGLDFARSKLTGTEQKYFAKQGVDYTKAYYKALPEGWKAFKKTLAGEGGLTKPDIDFIPTSTSKLHKAYTTPLRALEAGDQFFRRMTEQGELATGSTLKQAQNSAQYRLFRQKFDPQGKLGQGTVLKTWDKWNSGVQSLRNAPGGKWIVPFLQTPTNILKQGFEYSPLGITTLPGSKNPMQQLAKTMIGTTVYAATAAAAEAGHTTWDTPTNADDKSEFYAAGLQPYSVKIGDKWVSYSKLGPLAYPMAMASAMQWAEENGAGKDTLEKAGEGLVGIMSFFSDQSYVRGIGDWIDAARGDNYKLQRAFANIPSQLIPYRSLQGWFARLLDPVYRKAGTPIDSIKSQIPFLSKTLPAHETPEGEPSKRDFPLANSFLPAKISQEKEKAKFRYEATEQTRIQDRSTKIGNDIKKLTFEEVQKKYPRGAVYYSAEVLRSEINKLPDDADEEKRALLQEYRDRGYITPEVTEALKNINKLDDEGLTKTDRELVLFSAEVRARKIISRFKGISTDKRKRELLALYRKYKIITPEVEEALRKLQ